MILRLNTFDKWENSLDKTTRVRVGSAVKKIEWGLGVLKQLNERIFECKLKFGSGLRIYYTKYEEQTIVILCGGDKSTQQQDINRAESLIQEADRKAKEYIEEQNLR